MADQYLDRLHNADCELTAVHFGLLELAKAFAITGNRRVSDKLYDMAEAIHNSAKEIRDATSQELTDRVRQAQESSVNVLKGVLAGVELGQNPNGVGDVSDSD